MKSDLLRIDLSDGSDYILKTVYIEKGIEESRLLELLDYFESALESEGRTEYALDIVRYTREE